MSVAEKFSVACGFTIEFGEKYRGQTIARIGSSDEGLKWLDWVADQRFMQSERYAKAREKIDIFLKHPDVDRRLTALIDDED